MQSNVGTADRALRMLLGIAVLSLVILIEGNLRWLGLIGIMRLATGLVRWRPLYSVLGIRTCRAE
jgi:hypothetical protein